MKKIFSRLLPIVLMFTLALTFNAVGYSNKVQAKVKDTKEEKVFIKNRDGSISTNKYVDIHPIPTDFDATKANDEELEYYNLPKRPKDSKQLEIWKKIVSCKWVKPEFIETDIKHNTYNNYASIKENTTTSPAVTIDNDNTVNTTYSNTSNWAGFVNNQPATSASGMWYVPKVSAPSSYRPASGCQWVGVGGYGTQTLVQTGTEGKVSSSGSTSYYLWYELIGTNYQTPYQVKLDNISCNPGDEICCSVDISINGSNMTASFFLENFTTNMSTSFSITVTQFNNVPNSAEWIAEAPLISGITANYPLTSDIGSTVKAVQFENGTYQSSNTGTVYGISDSPNLVNVSLVNGTKVLAKPTDLGRGTKPLWLIFTVDYTNCFDVNWLAYK